MSGGQRTSFTIVGQISFKFLNKIKHDDSVDCLYILDI